MPNALTGANGDGPGPRGRMLEWSLRIELRGDAGPRHAGDGTADDAGCGDGPDHRRRQDAEIGGFHGGLVRASGALTYAQNASRSRGGPVNRRREMRTAAGAAGVAASTAQPR